MKILLIGASGSVLAFLSVIGFLETLTIDESVVRSILFWNIFLASKLVGAGILPICENCELMSLLHLLFWGFLIGVVGYSFVVFLIFTLRNRSGSLGIL